jgi:hypothetical protein
MAAKDLSKKWTRANPYVYIDRKYPRRMAIFWERGRAIETTYARWLWESKKGPLPKGMTIHHINGKKLDDRIKNYKLLTHSQHTRLHNKERAKAIEDDFEGYYRIITRKSRT